MLFLPVSKLCKENKNSPVENIVTDSFIAPELQNITDGIKKTANRMPDFLNGK
jgi:hypothetical protein